MRIYSNTRSIKCFVGVLSAVGFIGLFCSVDYRINRNALTDALPRVIRSYSTVMYTSTAVSGDDSLALFKLSSSVQTQRAVNSARYFPKCVSSARTLCVTNGAGIAPTDLSGVLVNLPGTGEDIPESIRKTVVHLLNDGKTRCYVAAEHNDNVPPDYHEGTTTCIDTAHRIAYVRHVRL